MNARANLCLRALMLATVLATAGLAQTNTPTPGSEQISAQFGFSSAHGNSDSFSLNASVDWNENVGRFENELDFNTYVSESIGESTSLTDQQSLDWTIRDAFGKATSRRWFLLVHTGGERNDYAGVSFRGILGPGFGRHIVDRPNLRVTLEGGVAAAWEKPTTGPTTEFAMPFFHPMMHWQVAKNTSFSQTFEFELNGEDTGDLRINSDTELNFQVTQRISIQPGIKVNWDNRPTAGADSLDIVTQTSISFNYYRQH